MEIQKALTKITAISLLLWMYIFAPLMTLSMINPASANNDSTNQEENRDNKQSDNNDREGKKIRNGENGNDGNNNNEQSDNQKDKKDENTKDSEENGENNGHNDSDKDKNEEDEGNCSNSSSRNSEHEDKDCNHEEEPTATPTPTPTNERKVNICHQTESENNRWNAISINESSLITHIPGHEGDFLYVGPTKENGHPTKEGDEWCAENVPTPLPTETPVPTDTEEPTETPTPTDTEEPTETPTPTDSEEPTETPTPTDSEEPSETPTPTNNPSETPLPTVTTSPTATPTEGTGGGEEVPDPTDNDNEDLPPVTKPTVLAEVTTPTVTPAPEVLGERTCTNMVKLVGVMYVDANKNGNYDFGEQVFSNITGKVTYNVDTKEYFVDHFISDNNGKWEMKLCPGEYNITVNKGSLPRGITDSADTHKINVLADQAETTAFVALLATSSWHWSWWWLLLVVFILAVIYYIYRKRREYLENNAQ